MYTPGNSVRMSFEDRTKYICLDGNGVCIQPHKDIKNRLIEFIVNQPLNQYPEFLSQTLLNKIYEVYQIETNRLLVTAGVDSALRYLVELFARQGKAFVAESETYGYFKFLMKKYGTGYHTFTELKDIQDVGAGTVEYIANPSNPLGRGYFADELLSLCREKQNLTFIIDESFIEYFPMGSLLQLSQIAYNVIVLRGFSKDYGLAGLRIGYVNACPDLILQLKELIDVREVNSLAQVAAVEALSHIQHMQLQVRDLICRKEECFATLEQMGIPIRNTDSNFLLIYDREGKYYKYLEENLILIRKGICHNYSRMMIGTEQEMGMVENILCGYKEKQ